MAGVDQPRLQFSLSESLDALRVYSRLFFFFLENNRDKVEDLETLEKFDFKDVSLMSEATEDSRENLENSLSTPPRDFSSFLKSKCLVKNPLRLVLIVFDRVRHRSNSNGGGGGGGVAMSVTIEDIDMASNVRLRSSRCDIL